MSALTGQTCPTCGKGKFITVTEDQGQQLSGGHIVMVRSLTFARCDACGEEAYSLDACRQIEDAIRAYDPHYYDKADAWAAQLEERKQQRKKGNE
jgi:YgiT-type zinc finger domain-containing protein